MRKMSRNGWLKAIAAAVAAAVIGAAGLVVAPAAQADSAAVESILMEKINAGRATVGKPALLVHDGLREKQRGHAQSMSSTGALTHDGMVERHDTATPFPAESNGAPDDGFTGCMGENVAYASRSGRTDDAVAEGIYQGWYNSPGHKRNMFDEGNFGYTVAGLGVYEGSDGKVFAALLVAHDDTTTTVTATPEPTPKPKKHRRHRRRR
jgi:uncharacterized protein YkwD